MWTPPQPGHARQPWRSTGTDSAAPYPRGHHGIEDDGVHPSVPCHVDNPPTPLVARHIPSQAIVGATRRRGNRPHGPLGPDLGPPSREAGPPTLELVRSGTLTPGGPPRRSALGPGSPTGSRRCSQKAFSVGSNPTRGTSQDTIHSLATMSVAAENIFSCSPKLLSILQRACPT